MTNTVNIVIIGNEMFYPTVDNWQISLVALSP